MPSTRRSFLAAAVAGASLSLPTSAQVPGLIRPKRLRAGDTVALINPSNAIYERAPYAVATESLQAMGFKVREAPNLRARYGQFGGTDSQRAADVNAMFADPSVHGILALTGGSGGNRILPLLDYGLIRRNAKVLAGFSDITALINAVHVQTGLVTFHAPVGESEWNAFSVDHFKGTLVEAQPMLLANPRDKDDNIVPRTARISTLRGGKSTGPLVGGNLSVLTSMAGSAYWPRFEGAILFLEDTNEYLYRVDRMLSTLKNSGALAKVAGVVLGGFTNCTPGDGRYGALTLDEIFDDYFKPLNVPVYSGALFGHIKRKFTLPVGLDVEMDADAGTIRYLQPAVV
jgi:muramoyltetrapeptide carboxypeptidase